MKSAVHCKKSKFSHYFILYPDFTSQSVDDLQLDSRSTESKMRIDVACKGPGYFMTELFMCGAFPPPIKNSLADICWILELYMV